MRRRIGLVLLLVSAVAFGFLKSVDVAPVKAAWSGKVSGSEGHGIAQSFTANFDSVSSCELFIGDVRDTSHHYDVNIYEYPDGVNWVARKLNVAAPAQGHVWLKFELQTASGQIPGDATHFTCF